MSLRLAAAREKAWIPACAGMTYGVTPAKTEMMTSGATAAKAGVQ
jgi:hypothetical protein